MQLSVPGSGSSNSYTKYRISAELLPVEILDQQVLDPCCPFGTPVEDGPVGQSQAGQALTGLEQTQLRA